MRMAKIVNEERKNRALNLAKEDHNHSGQPRNK